MNTPSIVSKLLPSVVIVTFPLVLAVQDHQTLFPPASLQSVGSPVSLVAPMLVPVTVTLLPVMTVALAKLSFAGALVRSTVSVTLPLAVLRYGWHTRPRRCNRSCPK